MIPEISLQRTIVTSLLLILTLVGSAQLMEQLGQGGVYSSSAETRQKMAESQIKSEVSETVELMAILSRTAGFQEFSKDMAGQYSKDTEAWFSKYADHPTVAYYKDIRAQYGISFERVTNMAVHLDIDNGHVKLIGDRAELKNNGWQNVDLDEFVRRLNKFFADSRFHEFFEQHKPFYDEFLKTYDSYVMGYLHPEWYGRFYNSSELTERFRLVIGFTYGSTNNGASRQLPGQPREVFAVCGYMLNPQNGRPLFDTSLPLHEFNHPFVNPLLEKAENAKTMQEVGTRLFQLSQSAMEQQHYNDWHIVINESLVRAAVIVYFYEHGYHQFAMNTLTSETMDNGFPWMLDVVTALRFYSAHRDQYPTFNDFYPEIARCLNQYIEDSAAKRNS